jgi:integrase
MWRSDFVQREVGGRTLIAASTRAKYLNRLENHIMPRWKDTRIAEFRAKDVLDWLHCECQSWNTLADRRNIMSGIFTKAQEWEILPDPFTNRCTASSYPRNGKSGRSASSLEEQTAAVLARLEDPHLLICETFLDAGTRTSEVTGLRVKHVDLDQGCIRIELRNGRGDIDEPKTAKSKRTLPFGALRDRYGTCMAKLTYNDPEAWVFPQDEDKSQPMWDSGVIRRALKKAAAEGYDAPGLGPHSLRRANITWRQEVGSSIETSQIAGHANTKITEECTGVQLRRPEELTRQIQGKRAKARKRKSKVVEIEGTNRAA